MMHHDMTAGKLSSNHLRPMGKLVRANLHPHATSKHGRRRGFGVAAERAVRSWRKPRAAGGRALRVPRMPRF